MSKETHELHIQRQKKEFDRLEAKLNSLIKDKVIVCTGDFFTGDKPVLIENHIRIHRCNTFPYFYISWLGKPKFPKFPNIYEEKHTDRFNPYETKDLMKKFILFDSVDDAELFLEMKQF